jgi:cytochrome c peroxidase
MNRFDVGLALALTALCVCAAMKAAGDPAATPSASLHATVSVALTAAERARVVENGPWPPAFSRDPTNRVSGNAAAIDFGRRLFFNPRFSPSGYIACVACHQPDRSFTDNLPRARGLAPVERNAVALQNLRLHRWYGWGGASDSLWMASMRPILDMREIGATAEKVAFIVETGDGVACRYKAAFGEEPAAHDAETVLVNVAKALAAYQETLVTGRTPFDDYRDALARGEAPPASYPLAAQRGLKIFFGRGNCHLCHNGSNFTDDAFRGTTVGTFVGQDRSDTGRLEALRTVRASRYNLSGRYNDDPAKVGGSLVRDAKFEPHDHARWRTPSLRNVAVTAPYLHNGTAASLYDVVRRYAKSPGQPPYVDDERRIRRADLSPGDVDDLVAFLGTLTDGHGARRPLTSLMPSACD